LQLKNMVIFSFAKLATNGATSVAHVLITVTYVSSDDHQIISFDAFHLKSSATYLNSKGPDITT